MTRARWVTGVFCVVVVLVVSAWMWSWSDPSESSSEAASAAAQLEHSFSPPTKRASSQALEALQVANDGPMTGYSREKFPHWKDASAHGWPAAPAKACTVREAALVREGQDVTVDSATCSAVTGRWLDPYTATWYTSPRDIQIDHVVPLAEAWRTGATPWSTARRTAFANDPLVAVAVEGKANQAKGDKDPSAWKPANQAAHCLYAKRWVTIKKTYQLTVSPAEKTTLISMLETCAS